MRADPCHLLTSLVVFAVLRRVVHAETHCAIDENDDSRVGFIADSPYLLRQPHSLVDLFKQVEWVGEKSKLQSTIKQQQKMIEKRYDEDDPDVEKRIHETDENCLKSKPLDLQTENFIVTYAIDLVPYFIYDMRFNRETIASSRETLQMIAIERIFGTNKATGRQQEPHCPDYLELFEDADEEVERFPNIPEPELADLDAQELQNLGSFLTDRLKQKSSRHLALYYASFYWRLRGETRSALKCLLRYLEDGEFVQAPGNFQLGSLYIKVGKHHDAVDILETVVNQLSECAECFAALGDAYVLVGNFPAAVAAFAGAAAKKREGVSEAAAKKAALLKCVMRVFEVMEDQHSNLLDTIDDVNDFKDKSLRVKLLDVLIEGNRANAESRVQAKLAYEHFMAGPVPHLNCYGVTQRFFSIFGSPRGGTDGIERLQCVVDDLSAFNASLLARYRELLESALKTRKMSFFEEHMTLTRAETFRAETRKYLQNSGYHLVKYAQRLAPYMSMEIDTPSLAPRYPLEGAKRPEIGWPTLEECRSGKKDATNDFFHLFLSPANKGFIVSDILTQYLALNKGELSPRPWNLPICRAAVRVGKEESAETSSDSVLKKLKSLTQILERPEKVFAIGDKRLKSVLLALATEATTPITDDNKDEVNNNNQHRGEILLGDLGQRIVTLLKYRIGAEWISQNLAALYLRYFGLYKEAAICLTAALQANNALYKDVAYTQLAQILIRLAIISRAEIKDGENADSNDDDNDNFESQQLLADAKLILARAIDENANEPLPHFLMGVATQLAERGGASRNETDATAVDASSNDAENFFWAALDLEPHFDEAQHAILRSRCTRKLSTADENSAPLFLRNSLRDENSPLCCWPNEQNVYCFKRRGVKRKFGHTRRRLKSEAPSELCFTLEAAENSATKPFASPNFVYYRCNAAYTGKSYQPPAYARLIVPFLQPAAELRRQQRHRQSLLVTAVEGEGGHEDGGNRRRIDSTPVLPLDYGGFSEERIREHQAEIPQFNAADLRQFSIVFDGSEGDHHQQQHEDSGVNNDSDDIIINNNKADSDIIVSSDASNDVVETTKEGEEPEDGGDGRRLASVTERRDVLPYDIPRPETVPEPMEELILLGERFFPPPSRDHLKQYCKAYKKSERVLEQPASTYVSVTAKGIRIDDSFLDVTTPISALRAAAAAAAAAARGHASGGGWAGSPPVMEDEPVCPDPEPASRLVAELDLLPAYKHRRQLKFYWPEKALRDALQSLGESPTAKSATAQRKMRMDEVATRLTHAMRASAAAAAAAAGTIVGDANSKRGAEGGAVDWTLSTASTLYWRVKGDAVNAIKCLRHSLNNSPDEMKDVALISLANVYQQAGFLHSALLVGGRALEISPNSVVAIHFTLANIYVSMGDFAHALKFYHSTLALQSKFQGAKDRIRAIHCETNGKFLPA